MAGRCQGDPDAGGAAVAPADRGIIRSSSQASAAARGTPKAMLPSATDQGAAR
jgi:hypothetical protein